MPRFYIAIEGAIGAGKTTLARIIQERFDAELLLEVFEENPFLSAFYRDRARYAFQTQFFFLLSRHQHQNSVVRQTLEHHSLVSDYSFAKDRLFAHLNLAGDELEMYERVHHILAQNIPQPDLIVFLRADTDVLMQRIASRDRPFERNMSRDYIENLRQAYERFFADHTESPVLTIDTNQLDIVSDPDDLDQVLSPVRAAIESHAYQPALIEIAPSGPTIPWRRSTAAPIQPDSHEGPRTLHSSELFLHYSRLAQSIGQLGAELATLGIDSERLTRTTDETQTAAARALALHRSRLRDNLAECMRSLSTLAKRIGFDSGEARDRRDT